MFKKISYKFQIDLVYRLSVFLKTNISLIDCLKIILNLQRDKRYKDILNIIINKVNQGLSLGEALGLKELDFDKRIVSIIKNGEYSGNLGLIIQKFYEDISRQSEINKKLVSSLIYPCFIFIGTIGMSIFLITFIFPKILPVLNSLNVELPFMTRLVRYIYEFTKEYGLFLSVLFTLLFFILIYINKKYNKVKIILEKILFKIPIFSNKYKKYIVSSHFYGVSLLLSNNQSLFDILTRDSINHTNILYREVLGIVSLGINRGLSFSSCMKDYIDVFGRESVDLVYIGEKTGNLSNMLQHIAFIYESEIEEFIKRFSVTIEPALMVFMGMVVGGIALSIILPIYEITNHLQG